MDCGIKVAQLNVLLELQVINTLLVHSLPNTIADSKLTPSQGGHYPHLHVRGGVIAAPMVTSYHAYIGNNTIQRNLS